MPSRARQWASLQAWPADPAILDRWHTAPGVRAYLLEAGGAIAGYGEIWEDPDEAEAELARIVVAPQLRGRGLGRALVGLLTAEARRLGWSEVWLRVVPDNAAALAAYAAAGFRRATAPEEAGFDQGQPAVYVWMRAPAS